MRKGYVWKKCQECGRKVDSKTCGCGSRRWSWAFRVDTAPPGAERRQVTRSGFGSKSEALEALSAMQGDLADGVRVDRHNMTVGEYLTKWIKGAPGLRPSTRTGYEQLIRNHLVPRLGDWRLQDLDRATIKKMYVEMAEGGAVGGGPLSERTVHRAHIVLRKALSDAVDDGLIARNPTDGREPLHKEPETDHDSMLTWSHDELATFLRSVSDDRLYPMWRVFAMTGMRRGEVAGLRWDQVDLGARTLTVKRARVRTKGGVSEGGPKTTAGRRTIDLDDGTVDALVSWAALQVEERVAWGDAYQDGGYVFTWEDGRPLEPTGISSRFARRLKKARVPKIRLHDMRDTHATLLLKDGVPPHVVSQRLGHSSVAFTLQTYAHVLPGQQADAVAKLAQLVDG